jgi:hypothetical protein
MSLYFCIPSFFLFNLLLVYFYSLVRISTGFVFLIHAHGALRNGLSYERSTEQSELQWISYKGKTFQHTEFCLEYIFESTTKTERVH